FGFFTRHPVPKRSAYARPPKVISADYTDYTDFAFCVLYAPSRAQTNRVCPPSEGNIRRFHRSKGVLGLLCNFGAKSLQHRRFVWSRDGAQKRQKRNLRNLCNLRILS